MVVNTSVKKIFGGVCLIAGLGFASIAGAASEDGAMYQLYPGDAVEISVWNEPELMREVNVLPDGYVSFPLAGQIKLQGLNAEQAAEQVAEKLKVYLPDPVVTVVVSNIEGNRVYLLGKVNNPGMQVMSAPTSVLQALSMAGGLSKFADEDEVKVIRVNNGQQTIIPVDYKALISGDDLSTNIELKGGDTIVVP